MMEKTLKFWWGLSLVVIGCATLALAVCSIAGIDLPDAAVRILGVLDLCALPVLMFTTVRLHARKKDR